MSGGLNELVLVGGESAAAFFGRLLDLLSMVDLTGHGSMGNVFTTKVYKTGDAIERKLVVQAITKSEAMQCSFRVRASTPSSIDHRFKQAGTSDLTFALAHAIFRVKAEMEDLADGGRLQVSTEVKAALDLMHVAALAPTLIFSTRASPLPHHIHPSLFDSPFHRLS